jgi:hypothetical protein
MSELGELVGSASKTIIGLSGLARKNWQMQIRWEHNNEKKNRLVAINARRFGRWTSESHPKRIFEFI